MKRFKIKHFGSSMRFNGSNQMIYVDEGRLHEGVLIGLWFKPLSYGSANWFLGRRLADPDGGDGFRATVGSNDKVSFYWEHTTSGLINFTTSNKVRKNQRNFLLINVSDGKIQVWLNGVLTTDTYTDPLRKQKGINIGRDYNTSYFDGIVDEYFMGLTGLIKPDFAEDMYMQHARPRDLDLHYTFDNLRADKVSDSSSNHNDATLLNSPEYETVDVPYLSRVKLT